MYVLTYDINCEMTGSHYAFITAFHAKPTAEELLLTLHNDTPYESAFPEVILDDTERLLEKGCAHSGKYFFNLDEIK